MFWNYWNYQYFHILNTFGFEGLGYVDIKIEDKHFEYPKLSYWFFRNKEPHLIIYFFWTTIVCNFANNHFCKQNFNWQLLYVLLWLINFDCHWHVLCTNEIDNFCKNYESWNCLLDKFCMHRCAWSQFYFAYQHLKN